MADTGIFATTIEVQRKVGANANATANTEAYINDFMTQAESFINAFTGYNWSDNYATLNVDVKGILKECASNIAAIYILNYDYITTTGTRIETENQINVLWARAEKCLEILKEKGTTKFLTDA